MRIVLQNIKAWFSTILGIILVTAATFSYIASQFFSIVPKHSLFTDLVVASIGFVLVFTDPKKIATDLFEILKSKFRNQ